MSIVQASKQVLMKHSQAAIETRIFSSFKNTWLLPEQIEQTAEVRSCRFLSVQILKAAGRPAAAFEKAAETSLRSAMNAGSCCSRSALVNDCSVGVFGVVVCSLGEAAKGIVALAAQTKFFIELILWLQTGVLDLSEFF